MGRRESTFWQTLRPTWTSYHIRFEVKSRGGVPDLYTLIGARSLTVWVELKAPTSHNHIGLSGQQTVWHHKHAEAGGLNFIAVLNPDDEPRRHATVSLYNGAHALALHHDPSEVECILNCRVDRLHDELTALIERRN